MIFNFLTEHDFDHRLLSGRSFDLFFIHPFIAFTSGDATAVVAEPRTT